MWTATCAQRGQEAPVTRGRLRPMTTMLEDMTALAPSMPKETRRKTEWTGSTEALIDMLGLIPADALMRAVEAGDQRGTAIYRTKVCQDAQESRPDFYGA